MFQRHGVSWLIWCMILLLVGEAPGGAPASDTPNDKDKQQATVLDRHGDPLPALALARLGTIRWRVPLRDGSGFAKVAFSPDGKLVIFTGDVSFCQFWPHEVTSGKPVDWFPKDKSIYAAVFSPDGKTLITAEPAGAAGDPSDPFRMKVRVQHWRVGTGLLLNEVQLEHSPDFISFAAFSPDGKLLITNDQNKKMHFWDTASGKLRLEIEQELTYWDPYVLSADGTTLAVVGRAGKLLVYEMATGKELRRFQLEGDDAPGSGFYGPALSPDGKTLVASTPSSLRIWETTTGKLRKEIKECRGLVAFSADGKYMACADRKGIRMWNADSLEEIRKFESHNDQILAIAFSSDGRQLVCGNEHSIALWDVATGKQVNRLPGHYGIVYSLRFTADGTRLATGSDDGSAIIWDLRTGKPQHQFTGHYIAAVSLAFSPDGKMLATGDGQPYGGMDSREAQIRLWNLEGERLERQFTGHLHGVVSLAYSPDGKLLVSGGLDARIRAWDPAEGKRLYQIRNVGGRPSLAFSPDGQSLLLASTGGALTLCRARTGEKLREIGSAEERRCVVRAAFVQDGKTVLSAEPRAGQDGGRLRIWDARSGRETRSFPLTDAYPFYDNAPSGHAFSPDGTLVATTANDRSASTIQLWDAASGNLLTTLQGHSGSVTSLAFSPDGKTLASASRDTTVLLWDVPQIRLAGAWHSLASDKEDAVKAAAQMMAAHPEDAVTFLKKRLLEAAALEAPYAWSVRNLDDDQFAVREKASRLLEEAGQNAEFGLRLALETRPSPEARKRIEGILRKLTSEREEQITRLFADLDGEKAVSAQQQLQAMGEAAGPKLERLLKEAESQRFAAEARVIGPGARWWVRQVLQQIYQPKNKLSSTSPVRVVRSLSVLEKIDTSASRQLLADLSKGPTESTLSRAAKEAVDRLGKKDKAPKAK